MIGGIVLSPRQGADGGGPKPRRFPFFRGSCPNLRVVFLRGEMFMGKVLGEIERCLLDEDKGGREIELDVAEVI